MYCFLAKQGQHHAIAKALTEKYGVKPHLSQSAGLRGVGVMVEFNPPAGVSKRSVDQYLYSLNIPGAKSRRGLRVLKLHSKHSYWDVIDAGLSIGEKFKAVYNKKFYKAQLRQTIFCDCCGPGYEVELIRHGMTH